MLNATIELLKKQYGFTDETIKLYNQAIIDVENEFKIYDDCLLYTSQSEYQVMLLISID